MQTKETAIYTCTYMKMSGKQATMAIHTGKKKVKTCVLPAFYSFDLLFLLSDYRILPMPLLLSPSRTLTMSVLAVLIALYILDTCVQYTCLYIHIGYDIYASYTHVYIYIDMYMYVHIYIIYIYIMN